MKYNISAKRPIKVLKKTKPCINGFRGTKILKK